MLNQAEEKSLSKMMTKLLRHTPEDFGVVLDSGDGSCPVSVLLESHPGPIQVVVGEAGRYRAGGSQLG